MSDKRDHKITLIVCSIQPEEANALRNNVAQTIGVEHEIIIFDNRHAGKGICGVYNECAERAQGEYLCFVHEDVAFLTQNWGEKIIAKLEESDCGVIGFAGSTVKYGYRYGWQGVKRFIRKNYVAGYKSRGGSWRKSSEKCDFSPVVCLDGMCLMVRKDVWNKCRFDEENFPGFHSYDTDFTTSTSVSGYVNYVCHNVLIEHHSFGSFSRSWVKSVDDYNRKWGERLPIYVKSEHDAAEVSRCALAVEIFALKLLSKNRIINRSEAHSWCVRLWKNHPFNFRVYTLLWIFIKSL